MQKDVILCSHLPETVSLQHLSLFIACPVVSTLPVSVSFLQVVGHDKGKHSSSDTGWREGGCSDNVDGTAAAKSDFNCLAAHIRSGAEDPLHHRQSKLSHVESP